MAQALSKFIIAANSQMTLERHLRNKVYLLEARMIPIDTKTFVTESSPQRTRKTGVSCSAGALPYLVEAGPTVRRERQSPNQAAQFT